MKRMFVTPMALGFFILATAGWSQATLLTPVSVSGTGAYNGLPYMTDGSFPVEGQQWQTETTWWVGTEPVFTIDYGAVFTIQDIKLSVDNNDSYQVQYSTDNSAWNTLLTIPSDYGEIGWGMDTMATDAPDPEYIVQIDFAPVGAQYIRIYATGGDNLYSVGELQAFGQSSSTPVPEPTTMLLFGAGLLGLAGAARHRRR
jgi:hypothetical protein